MALGEVLFVEDDDDVREVFASDLRDAGFVVIEARLAEAALDAIAQRVPDLVLLDIVMPPGEMSGMVLLARLREKPEWAHVPVIVLSAFGDLLNRDLLTRLSVRAVLVKAEVNETDIVRAVRHALPL